MTVDKQELLRLLSEQFSERIVRAFAVVPREDFVPSLYKKDAYIDVALPIADGQFISQPSTIAFMLALLEAEKGHRILEIGSGSGYVLALLSAVTEKSAHIYGIERSSILFEESCKRLAADAHIFIFNNDGYKGLSEHAPFDRIIFSAGLESLPTHLYDQLTDPGILVAPVRDSIVKVIKKDKVITVEEYPGFRFVPLVTSRTASEV